MDNNRKFSDVLTHPERLEIPLHWKKPRRIFVCSMADLFHEDVPFNFIHEVWDVMKACPQHTFCILTKRQRRMKECVERIYSLERMGWASGFWNHVWLGLTAENQVRADERIPLLLQTPATVRFVSCEPMLGPINFSQWFWIHDDECGSGRRMPAGGWQGKQPIGWIICGGESGPGARPMHPDWVRSLRDQCQAAGIPFHYKQWGEYCYWSQTTNEVAAKLGAQSDGPIELGRKSVGRMLDGREWLEFPKVAR